MDTRQHIIRQSLEYANLMAGEKLYNQYERMESPEAIQLVRDKLFELGADVNDIEWVIAAITYITPAIPTSYQDSDESCLLDEAILSNC